MEGPIVAILSQYLVQLPVFLVWLVGVILAVIYWRRYPKVSLLALTAIAVLFVVSLVGDSLVWLPMMLEEQGWALSRIGVVFAVVGVIRSLLTAVSWGLLLAAIFGWRGRQG